MTQIAADDVAAMTEASDGWQVEVLDCAAPLRRQRERELDERGIPLPFASRLATNQLSEYPASTFLSVVDAGNRCIAGFAVQSRRAPFIAGHRLLRVEELGASLPPAVAEAAITGLVKWVVSNPRVLRLSLDIFSIEPERRLELGELLAQRGFRRPAVPNGYAETLVSDLSKSESELFAGLHHSARRKIRQLEKQPVALRPITDSGYSDRMNAMLQETFQRTGGQVQPRNWAERIALSREYPELSRIVGLFRNDVSGPEALLAYAWGCHSGDHAYYSEAASTRDTGEQRIPLAYGVMWDLILWARRTGARWFDYGGITRGTHTDEDPLGGISDFKRYFSQEVVPVREEWVLDHHTRRAALIAAIHRRIRSG
jgi:hypothetical protein